MMKKVVSLLIVSILTLGLIAANANALTLEAGPIRMDVDDWSFFDDPIPFGPNPPAASGNLWGVFRINNLSDGIGNIYWQSGDNGEYIHGVYGNLTLHSIGVGGADPAPGAPNILPFSTTGYHVSIPGAGYVDDDWIDAGLPHNAYFSNAGLSGVGALSGVLPLPYLFAFKSTEDDFIGSLSDGYESGPGLGLGAPGTFGGDIITGTPWLLAYLNAFDLSVDEPFPFAADGTDAFRATTT
ncbi:MAG: hypothetical protein HY756_02960 [Nitrospirae bacterium]|nr:hypothetical protein [Nitrospirota bacterium]